MRAQATPIAAVKVSLQATSYLGSQVSNASINVVWETDRAQGLVVSERAFATGPQRRGSYPEFVSCGGQRPDAHTPRHARLLDIARPQVATTDATGAASATIPLDTLPAANVSDPGSSLRVTAEWVGPTRERIVRTASVTLALAERSLTVARTLGTDAPGLPWGVQVDVVSNVNGSSINVRGWAVVRRGWRFRVKSKRASCALGFARCPQGVPVLVTLTPNTTAGALCNVTSSCEVLSGDGERADAPPPRAP